MKRIQCSLAALFSALFVFGSKTFTISYTFDNTLASIIQSEENAVLGRNVSVGGSRLLSHDFVTENATTAWRGRIKNNNVNFRNTFVRMDIAPNASYSIKIDSIKCRQRMDKTGGAYNFKVGCTINAATPDANSSSSVQYFATDYKDYIYKPNEKNATADGLNNLSVWISGRGLNAEEIHWYIAEVVIYGTYTNINEESLIVTVSNNKKQKIRLGIDAERLWYWRSGIKDQLAQKAVGEMKSDYARIAINAAYELEQGAKNETAYKEILEVMTAFCKANSEIKFFASPRPLMEAYTTQQKIHIWGHVGNVPWSPYPAWIQKWVQNGTTTMSDGTVVPKWEKGDFDADALIQYYADYLNLMHLKGFDIEYLDLSNEQTIITPAITKYIRNNLPSKLNSGVDMPKFVVPSAWSVQGGIEWINAIDKTKDEHLAFEIAAVHNTGPGSLSIYQEFAAKAQDLEKEAWNSELHEWTGIELHDEIINSDIFWQHMKAGFTGIDTWLFFGPGVGKPHSMIFAYNNRLTTSGKYEIFKQVVNNSNGGSYVEVSQPSISTPTAAFVKDNVLSVWILNKNERVISDVLFNLVGWTVTNQDVKVVRWHKDLPKEGETGFFTITSGSEFNFDIEGESLYFFKLNISNLASLNEETLLNTSFKIKQSLNNNIITIEGNNLSESYSSYSIIDIQGKIVKKGILKSEYSELLTDKLSSGVYFLCIVHANQKFNSKLFIR